MKNYKNKVFNLTQKKISGNHITSTIHCLEKAFLNDPHINWYLNNEIKSKKYNIFMRYNLFHAYSQGFILSDQKNKGSALFLYSKKYRLSFKLILESLKMLYYFGVFNICRILYLQHKISKKQLKQPFLHLLLLGVYPKHQNKGLGKSLVKYGMNKAKCENIPFLLETSTKKNVEFYTKLGFIIYDILEIDHKSKLTLYFLKYLPSIK